MLWIWQMTGLGMERVERISEGGGPIKFEFAMALEKIYGAEVPPPCAEPAAELTDGKVLDVDSKPVEQEKGMAGVGVSTN